MRNLNNEVVCLIQLGVTDFIAGGAIVVHSHNLRHTFVTRGLGNGIDLKVMQELLGHANISTTFDGDFRQTKKDFLNYAVSLVFATTKC